MLETANEMFRFLIEAFRIYSGDNKIWFLYPAALIVILVFGKKEDRRLFLGVLVIECLTIFNPLFTNVLLEKFGFSNRFLRFFWMVLFYITIAYGMNLVIFRFQNTAMRIALGLICAGLVVGLGTPVFFGEEAFPYVAADNSYFIEEEVLGISNLLHSEGKEKPKVLMGRILLSYCQYDPGIVSMLDRNRLMKLERSSREEFMQTESYSETYRDIMNVFYYGDYSIPVDEYCRCLEEAGIDYVVSFREYLNTYLEKSSMMPMGSVGAYTVWKTE